MEAPLGLPISDRTFQYIAIAVIVVLACALTFTLLAVWLRIVNNRERRRWKRLESEWEPAILAVLAGERPADDLHAAVRKKDQRYFVAFLLRYARRLRGTEHTAVMQLAAPYLRTIERDLRHRHPEWRARALQTLGGLSASYSDVYLQALHDPSALVAMTAAQALAHHYKPAYAEPLLRSFDRFEHWNLGYLASMLTNMGPESAGALRVAFADASRPPRIRAVVATTLASLNDLSSVEIAAAVLDSEQQTDLVLAALGLIERLGGDSELPAVRRLAKSESPPIKARALRALVHLGTPDDVQLMRRGLDDPSNWVVIHAARALRETGRTDVLAEVATSERPCAVAAQEELWEARV